MAERDEILDHIRRTAEAGIPLGQDRFASATGITESVWGRYWARFGDAQREAGFEPRQKTAAYPDDDALAQFIRLLRSLGAFPTTRDIVVKRRADSEFPSPRVFRRLGPKARMVARLRNYAERHPGHEDVLAACAAQGHPDESIEGSSPRKGPVQFGSVYLLRGTGRLFKIGFTRTFGRRKRELAIQLPFDAHKVHVIATDDPEGVEAYWHSRFAAKRKHGEWFESRCGGCQSVQAVEAPGVVRGGCPTRG